MYEDFLKELNEIKDLAFIQGGYITSQQLEEAFPELDESKRQLVKDYLVNNHIGVDKPMNPEEYLSGEELNLLDMYVESLNEVEKIPDSVKLVLLRDCLRGDKIAKERMTLQYLESVIDIARLYSGQGVGMMDLIGEGNVALTLAFENAESQEKPEDIEPLVMKMIMNAMETLIEEEGQASKINAKSLETVEKVREAAKNMAEELLRKVTIIELSKESGISAKSIKDAMALSESLSDYIEKENE